MVLPFNSRRKTDEENTSKEEKQEVQVKNEIRRPTNSRCNDIVYQLLVVMVLKICQSLELSSTIPGW